MNSVDVLASMPYVFGTQEFCAAAGVATSSASRALRAASDCGLVSRIARGLWQRDDVSAPTADFLAAHPFPPARMAANDALLDSVFGDSPRRMSHMMALGAAGVPLVVCQQITLPYEAAKPVRHLGINVFREKRENVTRFATQLTERTWMSTPTRAAIETAQHGIAAPQWDERIAWAFAEESGSMLDLEEAQEISVALRMRAGLRRLSSIAHALRSLSADDLEDDADLSLVPEAWAGIACARRGDKWIRLRRTWSPHFGYSDAAWIDAERKVLWDRHPASLAASLLT